MLIKKIKKIKSEIDPLMFKSLGFSISLFATIFLVGTIFFILSMYQIIKTNKQNELIKTIEIERVKLETFIKNDVNLVLRMAGSPSIKQYFTTNKDAELARIIFDEVVAYSKFFNINTVFLVDNTDKKFHFLNDSNYDSYIVDPDDPENYWYNMTLYETESYNFNINYNSNMNRINLWINAPIFDENGKPLGMVGSGMELSSFIKMVYEKSFGATQLYFINKSGEITVAEDIELVKAKKNVIEEFGSLGLKISEVAKNLKPGEISIFDTYIENVAVSTIPILDWYVFAFVPNSIRDYKTAITWLFLIMLAVIGCILIVFNVFVARLIKPLKDTMDKLRSASKAKSNFLAKMSHEIRTPMNAITGMAELALREDMTSVAKEHIFTIKQATANLLSIINDILDFSKIENGKLEIVPVDYRFSSLLNDVVSIIRMRVINSELQFVVNIDSKIPNALFGDAMRIRQILLNILNNAVKYTEKGFISFAIGGEKTSEDTIILTIDVIDSGKGIKKENINNLFNDFTQFDLKANKGIEGTGLGLAITKNLINAMHGKISVKSVYGKGSTFSVMLPQKINSPEPLAVVDKPKEKNVLIYERHKIYAISMICTIENLEVSCTSVENDDELRNKLGIKVYSFIFVEYGLFENVKKIVSQVGSKAQIVLLTSFGETVADKNLKVIAMPANPVSVANILNGVSDDFSYSTNKNDVVRFNAPDARVLVVDDINTNLKVIEGLLSPYKMQVDLCLSGKEAIQLIETNYYNLIFMDHMMPEMDGIEATKHIRKEQAYSDLPIVALTANAVSGTKEMFLENGFDDFLSKPIDTIKLNVILEKWIPKAQQKVLTEDVNHVETDESDLIANVKIEGVDVKNGVAITGGLQKYMQILSIFHKDGVQKIEEIKKCLEANDYILYTTYIHALKSVCASIGAHELSELAASLEAAGKQEDSTFIELNNGQFLAVLEIILDNVGKVILSNKNENDSVDFENLKNELLKLKKAILAFDLATIDSIASSLQEFAQITKVGDILQDILINEYDTAISKIDAFA